MPAALINLVPGSPARGIGTAVGAGGAADSEAAATGFAGFLAAAAPAVPVEAAVTTSAEHVAVRLAEPFGSALPAKTAPALAIAEAGGAPVTASQTPALVPQSGPSEALTVASPAVSPTAAVAVGAVSTATDSVVSGATAASAAAGEQPTADGQVPPPLAAAGPVPLTTAATAVAVPPAGTGDPRLEAVPAAALPTSTEVPARGPMPALTDTACAAPTPAPAETTTDPTGVAGAPEVDSAVEEQGRPLTLPAAVQDAEVESPELSAAPERQASESVQPTDDIETAVSPAEPAAAAEAEAPAAAEARPAALQALLGLGLQTYLKAEGAGGTRPVATPTAEATARGESGAAPAQSAAAAGRPAAFAATIDGAVSGLFAGGDATDGDALSALSGGSRQTSAPATDAALAIRSQVAEQLARCLATNSGTNKLTIRLNPENLGRVDVDFNAVDDRLTVVLRASTPEAEQALRAGARGLTDGILERAARYQHVEVRVELRDGATVRAERQDERPQDQRQDQRQDERRDGRQEGSQDGRRDGRDHGRGRRLDDEDDGARAAWARAMADLSQEV